jgi:hypothetical protein
VQALAFGGLGIFRLLYLANVRWSLRKKLRLRTGDKVVLLVLVDTASHRQPAVLWDRDDQVSLFAPSFDVAMGLGHLLQRKNSVYDRLDLSGLNELFEE